MRTTLTIEDEIAESLNETVCRTGRSFEEVVNETLRAGIETGRKHPRSRNYRVDPTGLGGVQSGLDWNKALKISDALEDRAIAGEILDPINPLE